MMQGLLVGINVFIGLLSALCLFVAYSRFEDDRPGGFLYLLLTSVGASITVGMGVTLDSIY